MLSETCFSPSFRLGDARQHGIQVFRQAVELVAERRMTGSRPERSPPMMRLLAPTHCRCVSARGGRRKTRSAAPPRPIMPSAIISARRRRPEALRLAADRGRPARSSGWEGAGPARSRHGADARCCRSTWSASFARADLAVALVGERPLGPAFRVQHTRLQALDIAGQDAAVGYRRSDRDWRRAGASARRHCAPAAAGRRAGRRAPGACTSSLIVSMRLRRQHARRQRRHVEDERHGADAVNRMR
jgi:hypothetical protein